MGTKQILDRLNSAGHDIKTIFLCGGLSKNSVFLQCHSDATGNQNEIALFFFWRGFFVCACVLYFILTKSCLKQALFQGELDFI